MQKSLGQCIFPLPTSTIQRMKSTVNHSTEEQQQETSAQPPINHTGLKLGKPKKNSAGIPGLVTSLQHVGKYVETRQAFSTLFRLNQKGGIDCPGCAWPDPDDDRSSLGEYCENGVKAISEEAQKQAIGGAFFSEHSIDDLLTWSDYELGKTGRIIEPLFLAKGAKHYKPISWEEAFQLIAAELNSLESPDEAVFYTSGRTSNEAAFLYQLFVREFGTNNLPDCSNMCHESSGVALSETLGIGKGSVTLPDFFEAELILVIGQNPGTNHPRMLKALERCKENGGKIITVNPLQEAGLVRFTDPQRLGKVLTGGTALTDLFLPVRINEDVALLKAIMKLLWHKEQRDQNVFDWEFIKERTDGYETWLEDLKGWDFNELASRSGVAREKIQLAADWIASSQKIIICWAMGLTQHENGVDNIRELVNLLLLKGSIGKPGAGTCPVRGHSNVQGDRTMGIYEAPSNQFLDKIQEVFGFEPPRAHGYATVDAIQAMYEEKAKVFFAMGGNFLSATPDTEYTGRALRNCSLTVQVSTKLNRSHLIHGQKALILPCLGRTDKDLQASGEPQFVSVENSMGVVHSSEGILNPPGKNLKSEPAIIAGLAKATLGNSSKVDWDRLVSNYDHIRSAIEQVVPGFEHYNERVREAGGFYLPNGARKGTFATPSGKAKFTVNTLSEIELAPDEFLLFTIRSHDQFNTTIYGLHDRYRGIYNERRVVLVNKDDMEVHGLQAKEEVNLVSIYDGTERRAEQFIVVPYEVPKGCIATYFPEANVLVPVDQFARRSKTPISKSVRVKIEKRD